MKQKSSLSQFFVPIGGCLSPWLWDFFRPGGESCLLLQHSTQIARQTGQGTGWYSSEQSEDLSWDQTWGNCLPRDNTRVLSGSQLPRHAAWIGDKSFPKCPVGRDSSVGQSPAHINSTPPRYCTCTAFDVQRLYKVLIDQPHCKHKLMEA